MLRRLCLLPCLAVLLVLTTGGAVDAQETPAPPGDWEWVPVVRADAAARVMDLPETLQSRAYQVAVDDWFQRIAVLDAVTRWNAELDRQAAAAAARRRPSQTPRRAAAAPSSGGDRHYSCPQFASADNPTGDFAVPCYIIDRESDGNYHVPNGQGSSAFGAYQIMGLPHDTPPAEQDAIARGMPLCHWNPPNYCAGG